MLASNHFRGGSRQSPGERSHNRAYHLVLNVENFISVAVELFRPDVMSALGVDQLRGDPYARPDLANAALDEIVDAEFTAYVQQIEIAATMHE
jgi:hypothetical protein